MHKLVYFIVLIFAVISCGESAESVVMRSIGDAWKPADIKKFSVNVGDAQNPKNIIFVVRNNDKYPYSNIRFIVNLSDPKTKTIARDTVNCTLAKPNGEWLGAGFGTVKELLFQYKTNYKFPHDGTYNINVQQAMRNDNLPGIEDLGIKIQKVKP